MRSLALGLLAAASIASLAQTESKLSPKWEELTGPDFITAIHQAQGVCMLPFGIIEKHGPHLPLGTDLINVRYATEHAAAQQYAVIFPAYYFGQINEAKHEPGTVAYSMHMQLDLLQETTDEMARNGCKKIVIVNGHGGNESLLPYFAQSQLQMQHDYVVYIYRWHASYPGRPAEHTKVDMHAGESETAHTMVSRPDLVHQDRATQESGADEAREHLPQDVYTGIWWYARFPNHYSGDGSAATLELGQADMKAYISDLADALRAIKADQTSLQLQNEFFEKAQHPLDTKQ
ncbi:MAG TPA: creatininase family protein [Alloacidobacterium sp.]|nr:creatininase family protein [Alloacidobacterium sp.]